jgi:hypothetical protein
VFLERLKRMGRVKSAECSTKYIARYGDFGSQK